MHLAKLLSMMGIDDKGQGLTEYALVLVLIAVVVILMLTGLGETVNNTYSAINSAMP